MQLSKEARAAIEGAVAKGSLGAHITDVRSDNRKDRRKADQGDDRDVARDQQTPQSLVVGPAQQSRRLHEIWEQTGGKVLPELTLRPMLLLILERKRNDHVGSDSSTAARSRGPSRVIIPHDMSPRR